jgi:hypothetical protein
MRRRRRQKMTVLVYLVKILHRILVEVAKSMLMMMMVHLVKTLHRILTMMMMMVVVVQHLVVVDS